MQTALEPHFSSRVSHNRASRTGKLLSKRPDAGLAKGGTGILTGLGRLLRSLAGRRAGAEPRRSIFHGLGRGVATRQTSCPASSRRSRDAPHARLKLSRATQGWLRKSSAFRRETPTGQGILQAPQGFHSRASHRDLGKESKFNQRHRFRPRAGTEDDVQPHLYLVTVWQPPRSTSRFIPD